MRGNLWTPGSVPREAAPKTALWLPGASGNYISCPDSAGTSIAGDIDIRVHIALADWTPASATNFAGKASGAVTNKAWSFGITSTTQPILYLSSDGGIGTPSTGNAITVTDGAWLWLRATVDVDNGAGGCTVTFFTSTNGTDWTVNRVNTHGAFAGFYDSTAALEFGSSWAGANMFAGLYGRFELRSGIDGPIVAQWNGSYPHTRQRDSQGNIWTVNGTANAWQKVV